MTRWYGRPKQITYGDLKVLGTLLGIVVLFLLIAIAIGSA